MSANPLQVLHIDDDTSVTDLSAARLSTDADLTVTTTNDPKAVPAQFDVTDYDCVVSGYDMTPLDGLELYDRLQTQTDSGDVPYVLFVERGDHTLAADALNAGVDGYVRQSSPEPYDRLATRIQTIAACDETDGTQDVTAHKRELRDRVQTLRRRNERLDEFAMTVAHDLRTPLDLAAVHLELAKEHTDGVEHFSDIEAAHDRMAALIDDVLRWAREEDTVETSASVSVPAVVSDCWDERQTAGIDLVVTTEQTVLADHSRLSRLFDNLLGNAIDYVGEDGTVEVGDIDDGSGIYVADDGPGIPPEKRAEIFTAGHTLSEHGTGFGLAIVERIVEAHDWSIAVTESHAGGARFEIRFAN